MNSKWAIIFYGSKILSSDSVFVIQQQLINGIGGENNIPKKEKKMGKGILIFVLCFFLFACSNIKLKSLIKNIEKIENGQFYFDCSEEVNKPEKNAGNSIGYMCSVIVNEDTKLMDKNNHSLEITDFSVGDSIKVRFSKGEIISTRIRTFEVKEIILLK